MKTTIEILEELISIGEGFTFKNSFTSINHDGRSDNFSKDWIVWQSRVKTFLNTKFGVHSIPSKSFKAIFAVESLDKSKVQVR